MLGLREFSISKDVKVELHLSRMPLLGFICAQSSTSNYGFILLFQIFKHLFLFLGKKRHILCTGNIWCVKNIFFIVTLGDSKCYCHLLSQDRGCCQTFYGA